MGPSGRLKVKENNKQHQDDVESVIIICCFGDSFHMDDLVITLDICNVFVSLIRLSKILCTFS